MFATRVLAATLAAGLLAAAPDPADAQIPRSREQVRLTFAPVVKQAAPAVVNIYTRRFVQARRSPFANDPFFQQFFGLGPGIIRQRVERSLGSGVIIQADGLVVTNHHVVAGAEEITVVLNDRREFAAELIGSDEATDIAILRIRGGRDLPFLPLGTADDLEVGDLVLAIGNPFGVGQTVTSGIVSAVARGMIGAADFRSFIQTDAAVNPGNSGGALVTSDGELVGINTAIFSNSGGSVGIGFAIPAEMVSVTVRALQDRGRVVRPWLGFTAQSLSAEQASALGLDRPSGAVVTAVAEDGPGDDAGLRQGDVIRTVEGVEIGDELGLRYRLATRALGQTVSLGVLRGGREVTLRLKLDAAPDRPPRQAALLEGAHPLAGATAANQNPAVAEELGLQGPPGGVVLTEVPPVSVAARLGLARGDRVAEINGVAIEDMDDLRRALARRAPLWRLTILRDGRAIVITVAG